MAERMVQVPADLLKRVLQQAESDNHVVEGEWACCDEDRVRYANERRLIFELAKSAGFDLD